MDSNSVAMLVVALYSAHTEYNLATRFWSRVINSVRNNGSLSRLMRSKITYGIRRTSTTSQGLRETLIIDKIKCSVEEYKAPLDFQNQAVSVFASLRFDARAI